MIYRFKITLREVQPTIWRELLVEPEMSLDELHYIIQTTMLWTAQHTFLFKANGTSYGEPEEDSTDIEEAAVVAIEDVFTKKGDKAEYIYDFNNDDDNWVMDIELMGTEDEDAKLTYPHCTNGARNAPPEDAGGATGYETLLTALADPQNPDRADLLEWLGEDFDPEFFDKEEINAEFNDPDNWEEDDLDDDFEDEDDDQ